MERLPLELLTIIAHLATIGSVAALVRTSKTYHKILNPILYKRNAAEDLPRLSAVLWAAKHGTLATMKLAFAQGANLDIDGSRPDLEFYEDPDILKINCFATPLHRAVDNGFHDMAEWLLTHGANPHLASYQLCECVYRTSTGAWGPYWFPLHTAIHHSDEAMVKILLDHGARFAANRIPGLHNAVATASMAIIDLFLALPDFDPLQECSSKTTAIHHIAQCSAGNLDAVKGIVQKLLAHGVPMDVGSAYGTPPYYAIEQKSPEIALIFLDLGARIREPIERRVGLTILHQCLVHNACWPGSEAARFQVLSRLVATGMGLEDESDLRGILSKKMPMDGTALFFAAAYARDTDCVRLLLEAGANARATVRGSQGVRKPLLPALYKIADDLNERLENRPYEPSPELIALLLSHGAELGTGPDNESALSYACKRSSAGDSGLLRLFAEHASDDNLDEFHVVYRYRCGMGCDETRGILRKLLWKLRGLGGDKEPPTRVNELRSESDASDSNFW